MVPKFKKKPMIVEAVQFTKETMNQVFNDLTGNRAADFEDGHPILKITTIHGETAIARIGDWIVSEEIAGHYYPVKPDIFQQTYEPVDD